MPKITTPEIPGWFRWVDQQLFRAILADQGEAAPGDVVELGTYLGKSAVLIGEYIRPEERFVALDLFGRTDLLEDAHGANRQEVDKSYRTLTRTKFEENYLSQHDQLPDIVEGPSSLIVEHVAPGSVRFCHIDASHLYEHVSVDAHNAKAILRPGGIVVFDDWRSEHTPGVTAAVWESVFCDGLIPVVVTPTKLYGVFSDPEPLRRSADRVLAGSADFWGGSEEIAGHEVLRMRLKDKPKPPPAPPVDYARVEAAMSRALDERLGRWSGSMTTAMSAQLRRATIDASTITRVRRWMRGLTRSA